jgi:hypothetical protein
MKVGLLMRVLRRVLGLLLVLLIIPSIACAFWVYNANLVVLDKETYTPVVQTPFITRDFLVALVNGFAMDTVTDQNANMVIKKLPVSAWESITSEVFPETSAQAALTHTIDTLFSWLNYGQQALNLSINLTTIKSKLSSPDLAAPIRKAVGRLQPCTVAQSLSLATFDPAAGNFEEFPVCQPAANAGIDREVTGLSRALTIVAAALPDQWQIGDEIRLGIADGTVPAPSGTATTASATNNQAANNRYSNFQLDQMRAGLRLQSRLLVLLFLVPIGLLFLIVIVAIRSLKGFLRWLGWSLVVSGIVSLLPVILLPGFNAAFVQTRVSIERGIALGGEALAVFAGALLQAILNRLTVVVLLQVAGLIVVGLVLVFLSLVVPPSDDLRDEDYVRLEQAVLGQP